MGYIAIALLSPLHTQADFSRRYTHSLMSGAEAPARMLLLLLHMQRTLIAGSSAASSGRRWPPRGMETPRSDPSARRSRAGMACSRAATCFAIRWVSCGSCEGSAGPSSCHTPAGQGRTQRVKQEQCRAKAG